MAVRNSERLSMSFMRVESLGIKREVGQGARPRKLRYPVYLITDPTNGNVYDCCRLLHGGYEDDPLGACVALYSGSGGMLVVKTLPYGDETGEVANINAVNAHREMLKSCIIEAHVGQYARPQGPDQELRPENYTVVLMRFGGEPMCTVMLHKPHLALAVAAKLLHVVSKLYALGLAYTDMKSTNVLIHQDDAYSMRMVLCDYGSISYVGEQDGVATYPPPENPYGTGIVASERAVAYGIGSLLALAFAPDLEKSLRFCEMDAKMDVKKRRRNGDSAEKCTAKLLKACESVLKDIEQRDERVARVVRTAWDPNTTLARLAESLHLAIAECPTPPRCT